MKFNFKKGPLILSLVLILVSCGAFFFLYSQIKNNNKASEQAQIDWKTEIARRDEIKSFDRSMKLIEQERISLDTHFAESSDVVPFLNTLEHIAKEASTSKAEVSSVDILKDNAGLVVGMKAQGSFNSIYKFITLLENSPYELEFLSVDLSKIGEGDTSNKTPQWEVTINIKLLTFIP